MLALAIGFLALGAAGRAAPAETVVSANIVADTTWTLAGSPYRVTEPVSIVPGVTLTIEPGVIVQGEYATDDLVVEGVLVAAGTTEVPIRFMGQRLLATPGFGSGTGIATPEGAAGQLNLVQLYGTTTEFVVGNPYDTEKTVELRVRALSLPWDWTAVVSPATVTLQPGEETTATAYLSPGLAAPQGVQPRVAVEGHVDGELLGGVVVNVLVPEERSLDSAYELFLPALQQR